jgi:VWFA-related protein
MELSDDPQPMIVSPVRRRSGWCAAVVRLWILAVPSLALAQTATDLPSAPSSVATPKKQPPPPPATTAPSARPAAVATDPTQAATQSATQTPPASAAPGTAAAQQAAPPDDFDPASTIVTRVNEVNMVFTATDKHGHFIKDLKREDIRILDDTKQVTGIRSFSTQTDLPLQVALLVDASNSVRDRFKFEQEAAIEFLNQIVRPNYDKAFVVGFDATPEVTQDFTDNSEYLAKGVRSLRPGGGTAMYDAIYFSCRDKLLKEPRSGPVRRAVIVLSDGDDNLSHVSREEAIEMAQRAEVIIYTISTNISGAKNKGDKVLERLSEATGGRAFAPFRIQDVADAFTEIQDELRSQYLVSYTPPDLIADGHFRPVEISALSEKGLRVRSRHGYFAPSPPRKR